MIGAIHECGAALALPTTTVLQTIGTQIGTSSTYSGTEYTAAKSGNTGGNINPYRVDSYLDAGSGNGDGERAIAPTKSIKSTLRSGEATTGREEGGVDANSSAPTATTISSQDDDVALAEAMELAEALMDYTDGSLSSPAAPFLSASDVPMSE